MALLDINWKPNEKDKYQFVTIWLPAFFVVVGGIVYWNTRSLHWPAAIWGGGFLLSLSGYLIPALRRPLFVGWMVAAYPIGWTISHLLLAAIYYLVFTPIGLLVRLIVGDPMQRKFDRSAKTYWIPHNPGGDTKRYFKQF